MSRRQLPGKVEGVRERVGEIFGRCSADLHRYVRKRLRGSSDAADLTQEIFERFIRADGRARARNPYAYLYGIASNVVADAQMAQQRDAVLFDTEVADKAAATISSEDSNRPESIELENQLLAALEKLPDVQRAAIILTKRDGLSSKEAALRMGTTEGSVRVYVCEARAQLKKLLKQG